MQKILLIEEDYLLLDLINELLLFNGFFTTITTNYEEGHQLLNQERFDLIICNYSFERFNSLVKLNQICHDATTQNIPLLFMLGYQGIAIRELVIPPKQQNILVKPFSSEILLKKIRTLLQ